ncbi:BZ3500_MvSof-1268-A1-R1_Chr1-3g01778 [Microbotryum saponariae]|uniref:BZ3500_MvSof-1268-A1-R1_Chr1-3g01778 protein n=1 Tax=Microbotryum saponariae TaxID=289078 RepID=A0A2X0MJY4_9BASI|nr:BZ3500_MvSof-1268-A1-R1_Chr1-3g01778 [Microbotryum saponariae]SCZ94560.1 BZ3501_MvSof-1269-A2-R1_Chr1-3g01380 [Microbotryum saponariae]
MSSWPRPLMNPSHVGGAYHAYANSPSSSSSLSGGQGGVRSRISHAAIWKTLTVSSEVEEADLQGVDGLNPRLQLAVLVFLLWIAPSPLGPSRLGHPPPPSLPGVGDLGGVEPLDHVSQEGTSSPPPPGTQAPSITETCPVCSPSDDLCAKWGSQVLLRSRIYRGTLHRFGPFFDKLALGEDVKIGLLGGSISHCVDLSKKDCYETRLAQGLSKEWGVKVEVGPVLEAEWGNLNFLFRLITAPFYFFRVPHQILNGALSGMGSMFFESCWASHFLNRVDLMLVDVSVNDVMTSLKNPSFDALLRSLLSHDDRMAVLVLTLFSPLIGWRDGSAQVESIAQYYDVPVLSQKNVVIHHRRQNPAPEITTLKDTEATTEFDQWYNRANAEPKDGTEPVTVAFPPGHHPGPKGHELITDLITSFLRHERCVHERDRGVEVVRGSMREFDVLDMDIPEWSAYALIDGRKASVAPSLTCYSATPTTTTPFRILSQRGGWTPTHWKNKYYLMADKPGAHIVFEVNVPESAIVQLMYWRSSTVPLGSAMAWFDDEDDKVEMLRGKWLEKATVPALARFMLPAEWAGKRRRLHISVMDHTETGSHEFRLSTLIY